MLLFTGEHANKVDRKGRFWCGSMNANFAEDYQAVAALYPLARATLENVARDGTDASVTGPLVRGDTGTIRSHLGALAQQTPDLVQLYKSLTLSSMPLAERRGVAPAQLAAIGELLDFEDWRTPTCGE